MCDIDEYLDKSGIDSSLYSIVEKVVKCIKKLHGNNLYISNVFVSNYLKNNITEFDTTLWIFTNRNIIRCINFKENAEKNEFDFEIIPYSIIIRHKHDIKATTSMGSIECLCIGIVGDKEYILNSVSGNTKFLNDIYTMLYNDDHINV